MADEKRYLLRRGGSDPWYEVTLQEYLQAEYDAGFRGGGMKVPSTSGFSNGGVVGRIYYPEDELPTNARLLDAPPLNARPADRQLAWVVVAKSWVHELARYRRGRFEPYDRWEFFGETETVDLDRVMVVKFVEVEGP